MQERGGRRWRARGSLVLVLTGRATGSELGARIVYLSGSAAVPLGDPSAGCRRGGDSRRLDKREIDFVQNGVDGVYGGQLGRVKPQADPRRRFA